MLQAVMNSRCVVCEFEMVLKKERCAPLSIYEQSEKAQTRPTTSSAAVSSIESAFNTFVNEKSNFWKLWNSIAPSGGSNFRAGA